MDHQWEMAYGELNCHVCEQMCKFVSAFNAI